MRDGLTWTETSSSSSSSGAGVNSQGVTSSVGPVAVERGYTGTDSCSKFSKGRLGGETGGVDDRLGETGEARLSLNGEGPGKSSQGVTSSTGPVFVFGGAGDSEIYVVEVDENDFSRFDALTSLINGDAGTG